MTLLFDAMSAYLGPLLEKHNAGKPLVWEDLMASHAASTAILRPAKNPFVSSQMEKLHASQVKAYRDAAIQSVKEWSLSFPLQPMEESDTKITFVNRCITSINKASGADGLPNWKISNAKVFASAEIRKRATATFEKYHPVEEDAPGKENENNANAAAPTGGDAGAADEAAEDDSEGGAETEDGEITGDDTDMSDTEQTTGNSANPNRKKGKLGNKKTAQRKGTKAKGGFRNNKGGRGSRRGGRGGGGRFNK